MRKFCFRLFCFGLLVLLFLILEPLASDASPAAFSVSAQTRAKKRVAGKRTKPKKALKPKSETASLPVVTQIDLAGLRNLIERKPEKRRPLLVNFWATWCDPCQEEFPELVKINQEYNGRGLEFVTVSMDMLAEIKRDVPQFLAKMRAPMPAFLLKTPEEETAIQMISSDWSGGLPFTVLYDASGKVAYTKMGLIKPEILRTEIEKVLPNKEPAAEQIKN